VGQSATFELQLDRLETLAASATGLAHAAVRLSSLALKSIAKTIAATKTDPTT
jgi:hypothetical protein